MILVHGKTALPGTWDAHAVNAWYHSPAFHHNRCYHVYIAETRGERISDTVVWFPTKGRTPMSSSTDLAITAARDLIASLRSPHPASPISPLSDSKVAALKVMTEIFKPTFEDARDNKDEEPLPDMPPMALPGDNQHKKETPCSRTKGAGIPSQPSPPVQPPNTAPEPRVETPPKIAPHITYAAVTRNRNATRRQKMRLATPTQNKTSAEFSKLVTYTVPMPKSRHEPVKKIPSPIGRISQQRPSALRRSR